MKKALCAILCLVMLFSLCACGDNEDDLVPSSGDVFSEETWIDRSFAQAERLYAWFTGCSKPACDMTATLEADGGIYAPVLESGLTDTAALRTRLEEYFTAEIVEKLMGTMVYPDAPVFRDFGGELYYCCDVSGQVPWDIGERMSFVISQTDTEIIYHLELSHDYYASRFSAACDYRLVPGEDGKWRFASFRLPALLIAEQMFGADHGEEDGVNQ